MQLKVEILDYTKNPLTKIGECASHCYDTKLKDENHAQRIGKHCLSSGHGRNMELARVTLKITASARVIRELYTHIGGSPTRLQASTRYITYDNFDYYTPSGLTEEQEKCYHNLMDTIKETYKGLKLQDVKNDITGYILPLAMESTMILDCNARMLENLFGQRLCTRALTEFRQLANIIKREIKNLDKEWSWIAENHFKVKCQQLGFCPEKSKTCPMLKLIGGAEND